MEIEKQVGVLQKRLEKINYKLDNPALKEVDTVTAQLKAFKHQLTQLRLIKLKITTHQ